MTYNGLRRLFDVYIEILKNEGIEQQRIDVDCKSSRKELLGHCRWVLECHIEPLLHRVGGWEEAIRLLGCIQGTFVAFGLCTIGETREHLRTAASRPEEDRGFTLELL